MIFSAIAPFSVFSRISGFYFFYFAAIGVYIIFLPQLMADRGYSAFEIGVLFSAGPVMRFLVPFLFLRFLTLTRQVFQLALLGGLFSVGLFILSVDHMLLALLSLALLGTAWSLILPFVEVLALEHIGTRYGQSRLFGSIGFILVGLLLGHIALSFSVAMIAYVGTIAATVLIGLSLSSRIDKYPEPTQGRFGFRHHAGFWLAIFFMQMSFGGLYNFFTIYASEHGIPLSTISWLWTVGVLAEIAMFLWQRRVLHLSLLMLLHICFGLTAFRWVLLWLFPGDVAIALLSQSLHAFSLALFHTVAISYIYRHYQNRRLGQQFYLGIGYGLGGFVGSLFAGWIYGEALFLWMGLLAALGWAALLLKPKASHKQSSQKSSKGA